MSTKMISELCTILRNHPRCIIGLKPGCVVKHNFKGQVRVQKEDIKFVKDQTGETVLYDTDWYAPEGVKMTPVRISANWSMINVFLRHPNGLIRRFELREKIRAQAFNGGRVTEKRFGIMCDVVRECKEWRVDGSDILNFDSLVAEIRKRAGVKN